MANLVIPRRELLTRQPLTPTRVIDDFCRGVVFLPSVGVDLISGKAPGGSGTGLGKGANQDGLFNSLSGSGTGKYEFAIKDAPAYSVVWCGEINGLGASNVGRIFSTLGGSGGHELYHAASNLKFDTWFSAGSGQGEFPVSAGTEILCIVVTYDASNGTNRPDVWMNGIKQVLTGGTASGTRQPGGAKISFGGRATSSDRQGNHKINLAAYAPIKIGAELAQSLSENPWQIFAPRETRLFVPVGGGGTTTVTRDSAASYKVQGSVQSSSVASYGIRSAVQSSASSSYAIRAAIQQDAASAYSIRGSTQQSSAPTYLIRGLVDQAIAASYAIRSAVSSDASATYNILSATSVSASASAGYNIRGSINQDTAASYALRGSVTQDTSATYSILSASAVSSSVTAGFSIAQAVQAEIAASYIIRAGAVSEAQAAYVIRGLVQQSIAASYAIDGGTFSGSISDADIARIVQAVLLQLSNESIADAVLAALNATTIPVDMKKTNGITIIGTGSKLSPWRPA